MLAAERFGARVDRLVLLAPAVMFAKPGHHLLPPERIDEWRRLGAMPFFHYADREERPLNYTFYEDSTRYDPFDGGVLAAGAHLSGVRDGSVDPGPSKDFAAAAPELSRSRCSRTTIADREPAAHLGRHVERFWSFE